MKNIEIKIDKEEFKKKLNIKDGSDGKPGKDGSDGRPGLDGKPGKDGKPGFDGKDGSPDTGEDIVIKINDTDKTIRAKNVAGLLQLIRTVESIGSNPSGGGGGRTVQYRQNGTVISAHVTDLDFTNGITATYNGNGKIVITAAGGSAWGNITGILSDQTDLQAALNAKQDDLVSGTTIKTINGESVLGSGDIVISGGSTVSGQATLNFGSITREDSITTTTVNNTSVTTGSVILVSPSGVATADHDPDDYQWDNISGYVSNIVNGVSFDIIGVAPNGSWGQYQFNYLIAA